MNCFHAIMSIKAEFDPGLNEYVFSFTGVEIVSVISLTEHTQKRSVEGIQWKSISAFDLLENVSVTFSSCSSVSLLMARKDPQAYHVQYFTVLQIPRK